MMTMTCSSLKKFTLQWEGRYKTLGDQEEWEPWEHFPTPLFFPSLPFSLSPHPSSPFSSRLRLHQITLSTNTRYYKRRQVGTTLHELNQQGLHFPSRSINPRGPTSLSRWTGLLKSVSKTIFIRKSVSWNVNGATVEGEMENTIWRNLKMHRPPTFGFITRNGNDTLFFDV